MFDRVFTNEDLSIYQADMQASSAWDTGQKKATRPGPREFYDTWRTYGHNPQGWRYSELTEITAANVGKLAPQWIFQTGVSGKNETSPLVLDGMLYMTGPSNNAWAIDAKSGAPVWHYAATPPSGLTGARQFVDAPLAQPLKGLAILDGNRGVVGQPFNQATLRGVEGLRLTEVHEQDTDRFLFNTQRDGHCAKHVNSLLNANNAGPRDRRILMRVRNRMQAVAVRERQPASLGLLH